MDVLHVLAMLWATWTTLSFPPKLSQNSLASFMVSGKIVLCAMAPPIAQRCLPGDRCLCRTHQDILRAGAGLIKVRFKIEASPLFCIHNLRLRELYPKKRLVFPLNPLKSPNNEVTGITLGLRLPTTRTRLSNTSLTESNLWRHNRCAHISCLFYPI